MTNHKTVFMCDPKKNTVCSKKSCFLYGGNCRCTTDYFLRAEGFDYLIPELNAAFYSNSKEKWDEFLRKRQN